MKIEHYGYNAEGQVEKKTLIEDRGFIIEFTATESTIGLAVDRDLFTVVMDPTEAKIVIEALQRHAVGRG